MLKIRVSPEYSIKLSALNLRYEENGHINAPVYLAGYLEHLLSFAESSVD
jgi:hypothetical protein